MFDWISFFNERNIEFVELGPNVASGNINIHCPFCGANDPSHHMGISLYGKGWGCWRAREHRGKSPVQLIAALLGCTTQQAVSIAGTDTSTYLPENFTEQVQSLLGDKIEEEEEVREPLSVSPKFKAFASQLPSSAPYQSYLARRRLNDPLWLGRHHIQYCTSGPFAKRIIFLIHDRKGNLVSWVGRTIGHAIPRYKALTADPDKAKEDGTELALATLNNCLLWQRRFENNARKINTIVMCEGPFDAAKVTYLGLRYGVAGTCFFTAAPSEAQVALLYDFLPRFRHRLLLLDEGSTAKTMQVQANLAGLGVTPAILPPGVKDPGDLDEAGLIAVLDKAQERP